MACTCSRNRQCPRAGLWFLVHWLDSACRFDAKTLEVRTHICPVMNVEQPYCPQVCFTLAAAQCALQTAQCQEYDCALSIMCEPPLQGHFIHVLPCTPCSNVNVEFGVPWWRDSQYRVRYSSTILCVPCMPLSATLSAPSNDGASVRCVRTWCFLMSRSDLAPQCTMSGELGKGNKDVFERLSRLAPGTAHREPVSAASQQHAALCSLSLRPDEHPVRVMCIRSFAWPLH